MVNVAEATWSNSIGDPGMITVWTDPDFDPALRFFYYLRVIEIPTPRWTAYEAKRFNVMDAQVPMTTTERVTRGRPALISRCRFGIFPTKAWCQGPDHAGRLKQRIE